MKFQFETNSDLIDVILPWDPAIDFSKSNMGEYGKNYDESHLVFYPDKKPVRFKIKSIDNQLYGYITRTGHIPEHSKVNLFFQYGLSEINDFQFWILNKKPVAGTPNVIPNWQPSGAPQKMFGNEYPVVSDEEFNYFHIQVVETLGAIIQKKTLSLPHQEQGLPVLYTSVALTLSKKK